MTERKTYVENGNGNTAKLTFGSFIRLATGLFLSLLTAGIIAMVTMGIKNHNAITEVKSSIQNLREIEALRYQAFEEKVDDISDRLSDHVRDTKGG